MRYYKIIDGDYLVAIGIGTGGEEITEAEYTALKETIRNRPTTSGDVNYKLTTNLIWEMFTPPESDADPELSAEEALAIIMGGTV